MFDYLKELTIINVQCHKYTQLEFNKTGVHRIKAMGNSHGKSAIFKILYALFLGEGIDADGRYSLISWGEDACAAKAVSFSGVIFTIYLHQEAKHCYYELEVDGHTIRMGLGDNYRAMIKFANFHFMQDEGFSLNRYKARTTLHFTHTSGRLNYKVLDSSSEFPKFRQLISEIQSNLKIIQLDRRSVELSIRALTEQLRLMDYSDLKKKEVELTFAESLLEDVTSLDNVLKPLTDLVSVNEEIELTKLIKPINIEKLFKVSDSLNYLNQFSSSLINTMEEIDYNKSIKEPLNLDSLIRDISTLKSVKDKLDDTLSARKELDKVTKSQHELLDLNKLITDYETLKVCNNNLSTLLNSRLEIASTEIVKPIQLEPLLIKSPYIGESINLLSNIISIKEQINILSSLHLLNLGTVYENKETISDSIDLLGNLIQIKNEINSLSIVKSLNLDNLMTVTNDLSNSNNSLTELLTTKNSIEEIKKEIILLESEIEEIKNKVGVCDKCGNLLGSDECA